MGTPRAALCQNRKAESCTTTSMKKTIYILITFAIMLIVSRFVVRIVDTTVQIDNDIGMLLLLLVLVNAVIGFAGYKLYQVSKKE